MLERALNRIMLVVIASRFPETEKPLPLKTEKCHNIGCLYSISGFLMALTAALKAQIAAWYKALQEQIPDFIPRAPQRQMIADVAKTLAGEEGRHLAIEAPTGVGKTLSYLIPGIAIAREEQKTLVVSTANVALQDQIYSKDLPLLKKIIPDLKFTAAFGRGRYVCPRNLTALASTEPTQQDLLAFLDDELTPNNQEEQKRCAKLKGDLDTYKWDGLRDHTDIAIDDDLWRRLSTDKASCLNRNCYYYRECPFFVARREIQEAEVVVANHALVMAAMESEAVLPDPKNLLLVLDEGHHLPDVARDALEMSAEITAPWYRLQLDLFTKLVATCMEQFRPKTIPPLAIPERLNAHCEELYELIASLNNILNLYMPAGQEAGILHSSRVVMRTGCSWRAAMRTLPTGSTSIAPSREMLRTINPTSSICAQIITFGPVDSFRRISTDPRPSNRTSFCRRSASSSRICRTSCSEEAIASASLNAFNSDKSIMPLP